MSFQLNIRCNVDQLPLPQNPTLRIDFNQDVRIVSEGRSVHQRTVWVNLHHPSSFTVILTDQRSLEDLKMRATFESLSLTIPFEEAEITRPLTLSLSDRIDLKTHERIFQIWLKDLGNLQGDTIGWSTLDGQSYCYRLVPAPQTNTGRQRQPRLDNTWVLVERST